MEIVKKLNVPASFFFERVIESVCYDVRQSTGKDVPADKLSGFEYVKEFSPTSKARITIEEVVPNETYTFKTSTTKNIFVASYAIKPIDEKHCEVRYTENMSSSGTIQKLNDMTVGFLLGFFKKRRFKKMLSLIEESY